MTSAVPCRVTIRAAARFACASACAIGIPRSIPGQHIAGERIACAGGIHRLNLMGRKIGRLTRDGDTARPLTPA